MRDLSYEKQPIGDTIRWSDVYPNIDLTVRYVHDTLKVDTIVKAPLMRDIRAKIGDGRLSGNDYLTARFSVLQVAVMAEARQGGEIRDMYAEPFTINEPLLFVRDNRVIHEVRPVEAYPLDAMGQRIEGPRVTLRTAQRWQLERNGPGIAEMSVILADLVNLPDGDLCIDPTTTFGNAAQDTRLRYNDSTNYGSATELGWVDDDYLIFGFDVDADSMEAYKGIISATLEVYEYYTTIEAGVMGRAHRVTTSWSEGTANWYDPWTTDGGDFNDPAFEGRSVTLPSSGAYWMSFDVAPIMKMHYAAGGLSDVQNKGILLKMENSTTGQLNIYSSECTEYTDFRPRLVVTYSMPTFGADAGPGNDYSWVTPNWTMDIRQDNMKDDRLTLIRHFAGSEYDIDFVTEAYQNGMQVIPVFAAGTPLASSPTVQATPAYASAEAYVNAVTNWLTSVEDYIDGTISRTIIAVELGNEEEANWKWSNNQYGHYAGGINFATYYVEARNAVKDLWPELEIISGGSFSHHDSLAYGDNVPTFPAGTGWWAKSFLCGFIDGVTQEALGDLKGAYDYMPDTIAIHSYTGKYAPEGQVGGTAPQVNHEWPERLSDLTDICMGRGYLPNFSLTEYAFSPRHATEAYTNPWAPLVEGGSPQASETTQAVYYLRSCLANATMRVPGINWKYSLYFHHCRGAGSWLWGTVIGDWGFHDFDNYPGDSRAIRYMTREIFNPNTTRPALGPGGAIWIPLATQSDDGAYLARCGWMPSAGNLWGAIWRYIHNTYYMDFSEANRNFVVDGD